jgi:hypothetical protein
MLKSERLAELKAIKYCVASQRKAVVEASNNRTKRNRRIKNAVNQIRTMKKNIQTASANIKMLRDVDAMYTAIDSYDARIAEINHDIGMIAADALIERLLEYKRQIAEAEESLGNPNYEPVEEDIVS